MTSYTKYISNTSSLLILACIALFPIPAFAGDSDRRKITPPVVTDVVYEVERAVLVCPSCGFEVITTRVSGRRPCPECGEFLAVRDVRY